MSIDIALIDINSAINAMNSRKWQGQWCCGRVGDGVEEWIQSAPTWGDCTGGPHNAYVRQVAA